MRKDINIISLVEDYKDAITTSKERSTNGQPIRRKSATGIKENRRIQHE